MKCSRCGNEELANGHLVGNKNHNIVFRPKNTKFFTMSTGDVGIDTFVCCECGNIEYQADVEKLRKIIKRQES
jgi:hypothetical protein